MAVSTATTQVGLTPVGPEISTELATTAFGLVAGVFGGIAGLIAARKLEGVSGPIPIGSLGVPLAVAGVSTVIGAFLLPGSF